MIPKLFTFKFYDVHREKETLFNLNKLKNFQLFEKLI